MLRQYVEGVAPKHFARLFRQHRERKMDGAVKITNQMLLIHFFVSR